MFEILRRMWLDDEGQDLAEYGLLTAMIAIVCIAGVSAFGGAVSDFFAGLMPRLTTAP